MYSVRSPAERGTPTNATRGRAHTPSAMARAAPAQGVGDSRDGHVGLARTGNRLDHAATTTSQPCHERLELPAIQLLLIGSHAGCHPQRPSDTPDSAYPPSPHANDNIPITGE